MMLFVNGGNWSLLEFDSLVFACLGWHKSNSIEEFLTKSKGKRWYLTILWDKQMWVLKSIHRNDLNKHNQREKWNIFNINVRLKSSNNFDRHFWFMSNYKYKVGEKLIPHFYCYRPIHTDIISESVPSPNQTFPLFFYYFLKVISIIVCKHFLFITFTHFI